jgi:hypothetical protein
MIESWQQKFREELDKWINKCKKKKPRVKTKKDRSEG